VWDYKRADFQLMKQKREEFPVRESKCVGLLIMFVKPLIEKISLTLFGN
jgi:hypothetical protein